MTSNSFTRFINRVVVAGLSLATCRSKESVNFWNKKRETVEFPHFYVQSSNSSAATEVALEDQNRHTYSPSILLRQHLQMLDSNKQTANYPLDSIRSDWFNAARMLDREVSDQHFKGSDVTLVSYPWTKKTTVTRAVSKMDIDVGGMEPTWRMSARDMLMQSLPSNVEGGRCVNNSNLAATVEMYQQTGYITDPHTEVTKTVENAPEQMEMYRRFLACQHIQELHQHSLHCEKCQQAKDSNICICRNFNLLSAC